MKTKPEQSDAVKKALTRKVKVKGAAKKVSRGVRAQKAGKFVRQRERTERNKAAQKKRYARWLAKRQSMGTRKRREREITNATSTG